MKSTIQLYILCNLKLSICLIMHFMSQESHKYRFPTSHFSHAINISSSKFFHILGLNLSGYIGKFQKHDFGITFSPKNSTLRATFLFWFWGPRTIGVPCGHTNLLALTGPKIETGKSGGGPTVLKCIPGVELQNYIYTLIHLGFFLFPQKFEQDSCFTSTTL